MRTLTTKTSPGVEFLPRITSAVLIKIKRAKQRDKLFFQSYLNEHSNTVHLLPSPHPKPATLPGGEHGIQRTALRLQMAISLLTLQLDFKGLRHSALQLNLKIPIQAKNRFLTQHKEGNRTSGQAASL